ncbi:two pore channel protein 2 isoform X2 [Oryzias latipes]
METDPLLGSSTEFGSGRSDSDSSDADEDLYLQQAVVFIEDAIHYRSINHRVDSGSLRMYRCYYSRLCQWVLAATITVVLLLAFVERPSSLSKTSDLRHRSEPWNPPCGLTESIEMVCLLIFCLDLGMKSYLIGWEEFKKCKWLISYMVVLSISIIDWVLSISMLCHETLRVRRLFRPFFLLQNSSLMKKTLKCIKRTLPEIASVILLLALHLCLFTMIGMLLFAKTADQQENEEWLLHFRDLPRSITSLLVLLTTANNPDVMIPAYSQNRAYSIFFISFSVIGTYCLMNLLTAIIYNQFRGYLLMSLQTSIIRRRVGIRAAFQVLSCQRTQASAQVLVRVHAVLKVMSRVKMKSYYRAAINAAVQAHADVGFMDREQFQKVFDELDKDRITEHPPLPQYSSVLLQKLQQLFSHYYLTVLGNAVALTNVMCICTVLVLNSEKTTVERNNSNLEIINLCFILYYLLEMCVKIFAFGGRGYLSYRNNIFDGVLTVLLLVLQVTIFIKYTPPSPVESNSSLWELVRLVNMLIVFRFLRIIPDIKLMALVASTLMDLVKNLRAFAGILVVVYYVFAVLGIWLFEGAIKPPPGISGLSNTALQNVSNASMECGTYEQLGYWPNNFDDFASEVGVLLDQGRSPESTCDDQKPWRPDDVSAERRVVSSAFLRQAAIILLYNVMIVNNWQAFMDAYSRYTSEWSKVYFVCWWLTSSVMWVNLFVALILENFIYKWDRSHSCSITEVEKIQYETSIQLMFREQIQEPTEEELLCQLHRHPHLHLQW